MYCVPICRLNVVVFYCALAEEIATNVNNAVYISFIVTVLEINLTIFSLRNK